MPKTDDFPVIVYLLGRYGFEAEADRVASLSRDLRNNQQVWEGISRYHFEPTLLTRFMYAAKVGDLTRILFLIECDICINAYNTSGWTALHIASYNGHVEVVRLLLENSAILDLQNNYGETALHLASTKSHHEVVRLLCMNGAMLDMQNQSGETALYVASRSGNRETVRILCEAGAQLDLQDKYGFTALSRAMDRRQFNIVHYLCNLGAALDLGTPLMNAIGKNNLAMVRLLYDAGATFVQTVLFEASRCGHLDIVRFLCEQGAFLDVQKRGQTPLHAACINGNLDVVRFLCINGAALDLKITSMKKFDMIDSKITLIYQPEDTALMIAERNNHPNHREIVAVLREYGAL